MPVAPPSAPSPAVYVPPSALPELVRELADDERGPPHVPRNAHRVREAGGVYQQRWSAQSS